MTVKQEHLSAGQKVIAVGGLLSALAASSCCVLPLVLFSLGASGAWISNFTRLSPYQPFFMMATLICLATGAWLVHRGGRTCADGDACARPLPNRLLKATSVIAAILVAAALGLDFLAPLLLSS
jgi:mercuric ion transport protein